MSTINNTDRMRALKKQLFFSLTGNRRGERGRGRVERARGRGRKDTTTIASATEGPAREEVIAADLAGDHIN